MDSNRSDPFSGLSPDEARRVDAVCRGLRGCLVARPSAPDRGRPAPGARPVPRCPGLRADRAGAGAAPQRRRASRPPPSTWPDSPTRRTRSIGRSPPCRPGPATTVHEAATVAPPPRRVVEAATVPPTASVTEAATIAPPPTVDGDQTVGHSRPREEAPAASKVRYFGDYELLGEIARGRHGGRLPRPAGQPQPAGRAQDDPGGPARRRDGSHAASASRPRPPPGSITQGSCRSTRSASTATSIISAWASSRAPACRSGSPTARCRRARRPRWSGGRRGDPVRPRAGRDPPRPQAAKRLDRQGRPAPGHRLRSGQEGRVGRGPDRLRGR